MNPWVRVPKGDVRCRKLADRHYTRQRPGHPQWTRPGYTHVLYASDQYGEAVWCWWRPKWEAGVERGDKLRCIECTIFRREGLAILSSDLVRAAVAALDTAQARQDLALDVCGPISDGLITGIGSQETSRGRSKHSPPGKCFRDAGWTDFDHKPGRADVWLRCMHTQESEMNAIEKAEQTAKVELTRAQEGLVMIQGISVTDQDSQQFAAEILRDVKDELTALEEKRTSITSPMNKALKAVNDLFRPVKLALEAAEKHLKGEIAQYQTTCEVRNHLALHEAAAAPTAAEAADALASHTLVETPAGVSVRHVWRYEVIDETKVPREYLCVDFIKISQLTRGAGDRMPKVAGIRFFKEPIVSSRKTKS